MRVTHANTAQRSRLGIVPRTTLRHSWGAPFRPVTNRAVTGVFETEERPLPLAVARAGPEDGSGANEQGACSLRLANRQGRKHLVALIGLFSSDSSLELLASLTAVEL